MSREEQLELALKELLGFATRNLARAKKARIQEERVEALGRLERDVLEAREHEAERFYNVVKDRVAQALR